MLYRVSPEYSKPPVQFKPEADDSPDVMSLQVGYSYACIGTALSLIDLLNNSDENSESIKTQLGNGFTMWSGTETSGNRSLTFIYEEMHDVQFEKDTLSMLWVTQPDMGGLKPCYLITRNQEGGPVVHRYSSRKGWHTPSARNMKKIFHNTMLPLDKSQNVVGRLAVLRKQDSAYFQRTLEEFPEDRL